MACSVGWIVRRAVGIACALWVVLLAWAAQRLLSMDKGELLLRSGQLSLAYRALMHNSITVSMWLKDLKYFTLSEPLPAALEQTFQFQPGDNHSVQICRLSMYCKKAEELHAGLMVSPITDSRVTLPPPARAEAYVQACLEVLAAVPAEVRRHLEALDPVPPPWQFHLNITHPWMTGRFTGRMWNGINYLMGQNPGVEHPEEAVRFWEVDREVQAAALPSLDGRRKPMEELLRLPSQYLEGLKELDIWPVRDDRIEVEEIPQAIREGRTVVFDATRLCGKEIFNLTIPDISRMHGPLSKDIPAFKIASSGYGDNTYDSLEELALRFSTWDKMGWQHYPDFGPFSDIREVVARDLKVHTDDWVTRAIDGFISWVANMPKDDIRIHLGGVVMKEYRQKNTQTTIHVKRLPHFPLQDMYKNMGSPGWVDRLWNLLWIGPVSDFWHFDEEDNLLICVSGNIFVAVMEQNVTDIVSGTRNVGLGFNNLIGFFYRRKPNEPHWIDFNNWARKVPIHFLKLEPGMGITVPSRTYHNVMALDGNRILMNCFFYPKWRAIEDDPTARHHWFSKGRQADTLKAMWHLKSRSLWRLWDSRHIGGFFAGYKLEFF